MYVARTMVLLGVATSCARREPTPLATTTPTSDASAVPAPPPSAPPPPDVPGLAPWALEYTDAQEAHARGIDAGQRECAAPSKVVVDVRFAVSDAGAVLAIPSRGVSERIWTAPRDNPWGCSSDVTPDNVLRFRCVEDMTSVAGRAFRVRQELVVGLIDQDGERTRRVPLPCGAEVRFHAGSRKQEPR